MADQAALFVSGSFTAAHVAAMRAAIDAAKRGTRGANPLVGAALLHADGAVTTGFHAGAGHPHAEVEAISAARAQGRNLADATLLVTLEPCNHTGRTGPCSAAIIEAGIPRVIFAVDDDTTAAGGGNALRAAGVDVQHGLLESEARSLNARWFAATQAGRPFVTAKIAQSLDGRGAASDGTSQWITGPESRAHAHAVRGAVDAIAVGTGTVIADDPALSARGPLNTHGSTGGTGTTGGTGATSGGRKSLLTRQPVPVVLGASDLPPAAQLSRNPALVHLRSHDLEANLHELHTAGIRHLLVEGGPTLVSAFIAANLVDELHVYTAPVLLGAGTQAVLHIGITSIAQAQRWVPDATGSTRSALTALGQDTLLRLIPPPPAAGSS